MGVCLIMVNSENKIDLDKRLKRIEGQVRGVGLMVDDGRYCIDILNQTRAISAAIKKVEDIILKGHLESCVKESFLSRDIDDQNKKIDEVINLISKYR